jgi:hypothetical protein
LEEQKVLNPKQQMIEFQKLLSFVMNKADNHMAKIKKDYVKMMGSYNQKINIIEEKIKHITELLAKK